MDGGCDLAPHALSVGCAALAYLIALWVDDELF
jgi:hypothetical protein